jgi:urease accessory protein UreH
MPKTFRHHLKDATVHYEELINHNAQVSTITQSLTPAFQTKSNDATASIQIEITSGQALESDFQKLMSFR